MSLLKKVGEKIENSVLSINPNINASKAYIKAKYQRECTEEEILKSYISSVNDSIESRAINGHFSCMMEIDDDLIQYIPYIQKKFSEELDFVVYVFTPETKLNDNHKLNIKKSYLTIFWDNSFKYMIKNQENKQ